MAQRAFTLGMVRLLPNLITMPVVHSMVTDSATVDIPA
jgi:hypothetical protein